MCPKAYHLVLEGPTACADDDIHYAFIDVSELTGSKKPLLIKPKTLEQLITFCDADDKDNYYCYEDIKRVDTDGKEIPHKDLVLLSSVGLYGEVFSVILKKAKDTWQIIAVESTPFVHSSDFTKLPSDQKGGKILEMVNSYITQPKEYSTIHVVKPYREGRKYPFG